MLTSGFVAKALGVFVLALAASALGAFTGRPRAVSEQVDRTLTPGWVLFLIGVLAAASWPLRMQNTVIALGSWIVGAFLLGRLSERLAWARRDPETTGDWVERVRREEAYWVEQAGRKLALGLEEPGPEQAREAVRRWGESVARYRSEHATAMRRVVGRTGGLGFVSGRAVEEALGSGQVTRAAKDLLAAKESLARLGEAPVPFLLEARSIPADEVRTEVARIVQSLVDTGDERGAAALGRIFVRARAHGTRPKQGLPQRDPVYDEIEKACRHFAASVPEVADAVRRSDRLLELEAALLGNPPEPGEQAAAALAELGSAGAEVLARHASHKKFGVRKRVILGLKNSPDERARGVLDERRRTEDNWELLQLLRS
jgi:hypothetical protein